MGCDGEGVGSEGCDGESVGSVRGECWECEGCDGETVTLRMYNNKLFNTIMQTISLYCVLSLVSPSCTIMMIFIDGKIS